MNYISIKIIIFKGKTWVVKIAIALESLTPYLSRSPPHWVSIKTSHAPQPCPLVFTLLSQPRLIGPNSMCILRDSLITKLSSLYSWFCPFLNFGDLSSLLGGFGRGSSWGHSSMPWCLKDQTFNTEKPITLLLCFAGCSFSGNIKAEWLASLKGRGICSEKWDRGYRKWRQGG